MKLITLLASVLLSFISWSQRYIPFQGKLIYDVYFYDSINPNNQQASKMVLYTNDTLVRVETENIQLGKQILIKNLPLNKYYIMMEFEGTKYAIQQHVKNDISPSKFTFKKKFGSKKLNGLKVKRVVVGHKNRTHKQTVTYLKHVNPIYLEAIKGIPGLPIEYQIQTEEGIYLYKLIELKQEIPSKNLFGIPADYKRVTFEEFIQQMGDTN
jgi:hypothetical protein